jgi:sarcosine oxidase subunit alpha
MTIAPKNGGPSRTVDGRRAARLGRLDAVGAPVLAVARQGRFDEATKRFLPGAYAQDCVSVGACNGTDNAGGDDRRGAEGRREGGEGAGGAAKGTKLKADGSESLDRRHASAPAPGAGPDTTVKAFVDFQNDVTAKDIRQAVREGMRSIEHVKRFTTNGMATDQGKTSNMHGLAIAADALGKDMPEVGLTTFRPPYTPVTFGAIVNHARGPLFDPTRRTAIHPWAEANGAVFEDVGQWKRAWYYPKPARTCTPRSTANA